MIIDAHCHIWEKDMIFDDMAKLMDSVIKELKRLVPVPFTMPNSWPFISTPKMLEVFKDTAGS